jgi:hypothetical protein
MQTRTRNIILILLALIYTWLRFRHAFDPGMALTNAGDGLGTMGVLAHFRAAFETRGLLVNLPTEQLTVFTLDGGLPSEQLATMPWKLAYYFATAWFTADNAYDGLCALAFLLNMIAGYAVARFWGVRPLLAVVAALLLANLDNFDARIRGHLGLCFYCVSLAQLAVGLAFARAPSIRTGVVLGLVSALAFTQNEYYGYFGGIFTALLVLVYLVLDRDRAPLNAVGLARAFAGAAIAFLALMVVFYPGMMLPKLMPSWFEISQVIERSGHPRSDFSFYATHRMLGFFAPGFGDGFSSWNAGNPAEFTFRLGLAVPLAVMGMGAWAWTRLERGPRQRFFRMMAALLMPCAAMVLLAMPEDRRLSLATLTYHVAPMFRVGTRAYLFIDIALVLAFAIVCNVALDLASSAVRLRAWKVPALAILCAIAFADVSHMRPLAIPVVELPSDRPALEALRNAPQGMVLEVPVMSNAAVPEASYPYLYDFEFHRHTSANPSTRIGILDYDFAFLLDRAAFRVNRPADRDLAELGPAGVRYLVVNRKAGVSEQLFLHSTHLRLIASDSGILVFEVNNYDPAGNYWRDFILGGPIYQAWSGCGAQYERNGSPERTCTGKSTVQLRNVEAAASSGMLKCEVGGANLLVESRAAGYRRRSADGHLDIPFSVPALGQTSFTVTPDQAGSEFVLRGCDVVLPTHSDRMMGHT